MDYLQQIKWFFRTAKMKTINAQVAHIYLASLKINLSNEIKSEYFTHYTIYSTNIYQASIMGLKSTGDTSVNKTD